MRESIVDGRSLRTLLSVNIAHVSLSALIKLRASRTGTVYVLMRPGARIFTLADVTDDPPFKIDCISHGHSRDRVPARARDQDRPVDHYVSHRQHCIRPRRFLGHPRL